MSTGRVKELVFGDGYSPAGVTDVNLPTGKRFEIEFDGSETFQDVDLTGLNMNANYCMVRVRNATSMQEGEFTTDPTDSLTIRVSADAAPAAGTYYVYVIDVGGY